jgi:periplasmic protein TonB
MFMARRPSILTLSLLAHGGIALAIGGIQARKTHAATAIEIAESAKKKQAQKLEEKPPPKAERPKPSANRRPVAAQPVEAPPPEASPLDSLPDLGLALQGGVEGDGVALPAGPQARAHAPGPGAKVPVVKRAAKLASAGPADTCDEPPAKPKPRSVPQPGYTEQALAAGVEGKVRVQITVDETGRVSDVKLLQGLGYGLDEAALAAARRALFDPALRCGKPVSATFTISMRFTKP